MRVAFIGQTATPRSSNVEHLRLLNCFSEVVESKQGKTPIAIYGMPGLALFGACPGFGNIRGMFSTTNGRCLVVRGSGLYELTASGVFTLLGTLDTDAGVVQFDQNTVDIMLVDGFFGYTVPLTGVSVTQIADPNMPASARVAFLDNYLVFLKAGTGQFVWTDLVSTVIDSLNFATAEGSPDPLVSLLAVHRELWLFGSTSTEVWVTSGDADTPFIRVQGAFQEHGTAAAQSPALVGETICWLGANKQGSGMVLRAQGYNAERISTHPLEQTLQSYITLADAHGWGEQREGHLRYVLTFPTANATWVYDLTTGLWSEMGYLSPVSGQVGRHRANAYTYAFGKHLYGDYSNGNVYVSSMQVYTDNGDAIRREVILPPLFDGDLLRLVQHRQFHLDMETGVGLYEGAPPGAEPVVLVNWSNDGGHTWGSERSVSLGQGGAYTTRAKLTQLGSARDRRYKIAWTYPSPFVLSGVYVETQGLTT